LNSGISPVKRSTEATPPCCRSTCTLCHSISIQTRFRTKVGRGFRPYNAPEMRVMSNLEYVSTIDAPILEASSIVEALPWTVVLHRCVCVLGAGRCIRTGFANSIARRRTAYSLSPWLRFQNKCGSSRRVHSQHLSRQPTASNLSCDACGRGGTS